MHRLPISGALVASPTASRQDREKDAGRAQAPEARTGGRAVVLANARALGSAPLHLYVVDRSAADDGSSSRARAAAGDGGKCRGARRGRRDQVTERQARRRTCRDAHVRRAAPRNAPRGWFGHWWSGKRRTGRVEASERERERERERRRARVGRRLRAGPCDAPGQFPRGVATARNWA